MKRLFSLLLVLVMLAGLCVPALAAEEIVIEEPGEEIVEEPAAGEPMQDGADIAPLNTWIKDGKIYWDSHPGTDHYRIYIYYGDGANGYTRDGNNNDRFSYDDMPFDLRAFLLAGDELSQTVRIRVYAEHLRSSGVEETLAQSPDWIEYEFVNPILWLEMPVAWWEGTTIRWEKQDLSRFGVTDEDVKVSINLYEDGIELASSRLLTDYSLSGMGTSWNVSKYIEYPDRNYSFLLKFTGGGKTYSETFHSVNVLGRDLLNGHDSRLGLISSADIDLKTPKAGTAIPCPASGVQAKGSHFTIGEQFWCTSYSTMGKITSGSFENGKTYYYYAELIPDDGWEFAGSAGRVTTDELQVTACGVSSDSMAKNANGHVVVYIPVKAAGPEYGVNAGIVLGGFTEPTAGAPVQSKAVSAGTDYTVSSQKWSESPLGFGTTKDTVFQSGKTYYWICYVKLSGGYGFPAGYRGMLTLNGKEITSQTGEEYADAALNGKPIRYYSVSGDTMSITISYTPGASAASVKLSSDAKSAQAANFAGLYARVALVLDNNGQSGLYVTQATINTDGSIVIPSFMVPGLKVKGVNIALVPTLGDISSAQPTVRASDFRML